MRSKPSNGLSLAVDDDEASAAAEREAICMDPLGVQRALGFSIKESAWSMVDDPRVLHLGYKA